MLLAARTLAAHPVLAQPVDAGEEPTGAPIVYNLTPTEGTIVAQDEPNRAAARIETQREVGLAWAEISVNGRRRPSALDGTNELPADCQRRYRESRTGGSCRGEESDRLPTPFSGSNADGMILGFTTA